MKICLKWLLVVLVFGKISIFVLPANAVEDWDVYRAETAKISQDLINEYKKSLKTNEDQIKQLDSILKNPENSALLAFINNNTKQMKNRLSALEAYIKKTDDKFVRELKVIKILKTPDYLWNESSLMANRIGNSGVKVTSKSLTEDGSEVIYFGNGEYQAIFLESRNGLSFPEDIKVEMQDDAKKMHAPLTTSTVKYLCENGKCKISVRAKFEENINCRSFIVKAGDKTVVDIDPQEFSVTIEQPNASEFYLVLTNICCDKFDMNNLILSSKSGNKKQKILRYGQPLEIYLSEANNIFTIDYEICNIKKRIVIDVTLYKDEESLSKKTKGTTKHFQTSNNKEEL